MSCTSCCEEVGYGHHVHADSRVQAQALSYTKIGNFGAKGVKQRAVQTYGTWYVQIPALISINGIIILRIKALDF